MSNVGEQRLEALLGRLISKPELNSKSDSVISELDDLIKELQPDQSRVLLRATVLKHALVPNTEDSHKTYILQAYGNLVADEPTNVESLLEACRAFIVFEETAEATKILSAAVKQLGLFYEIEAVPLKLTKYQEKPVLRLSCLTEGQRAENDGNGDSIEYVPLHSDSQLEIPEFVNAADRSKCTDRLPDLAYVALLLQAEISVAGRPLDHDSDMLPYISRVTESADFSKIHWAIQERALYERSLHEQTEIEHLERGTVQLIKIAHSLHSPSASSDDRLRYAYLLHPLPWYLVDEMAARRLVAMADFANAVVFYERLAQPLELAVCYAAIGSKEKAMKTLEAPELFENARALMLMGDITQSASHWERAWEVGKLPEAKLRLAQQSASEENAPSVQNHLDQLLEVYPSNYDALYLAGVTALSMQDWDRAAKELRRALAIKDDDPRTWSNLSTALLYKEQPEQAHQALKQALRTNQSSDPDLKTISNFVALSAQLADYDEVVTGLIQLCRLADRGSAEYVARTAGVLPRLVTYYVKQPYTKSGAQTRVVNLFRTELRQVIPEDDPTLARLTGRIEFWTERYWAGFASYAAALKASTTLAQSNGGKREWARVKLYATEYAEALERDGDKEGRIEGSKACPDWRTKRVEALKLVEQSEQASGQ